MTIFTVVLAGKTQTARTDKARSIAIPQTFTGHQPNHFSAPQATSRVWVSQDFVGDTRRGGSCNVQQVTLMPHCNGTHTETVSHVTNTMHTVAACGIPIWMACTLISVTPRSGSNEHYTPALSPTDKVIDSQSLANALKPWGTSHLEALVIRTLPNPSDKAARRYGEQQEPPFFTHQAMHLINTWGVQHLVVDLPSIDRMHDDGLLSNHRLFWRLPATGHECPEQAWKNKTITELAYIHNDLVDGHYLMNLQFVDWVTDAVPSRPTLIPLEPQA